MTDGETVFIPANRGNGPHKVHSDPDCRALSKAAEVFEKPRSVLEGHMLECKICSGEWKENVHRDGKLDGVQALEGADPEDFGLSPIGARGGDA